MLWLYELIFRNKLYFCVVISYLCRRGEVTELKNDPFFTRHEPNLAWIKDKLLLGVTHFLAAIATRHKTGSALALRETKLTWRSESPFLVGPIIHKRQGRLCFNLRNVQILVTLYTMIYYQIWNLSIVFSNPVEWPHIHWYIIPAVHLRATSSNAENWPQ